jgi:methylmalonyl-CoA mutase
MQLDEFAPLTNEDWKRLIVKSIKAETEAEKLSFYEQKLVQKPEPGVEIQPFYTAEDMAGLDYLKGFHRLWAQTKKTTGWMNVVAVTVYDEKTANAEAREALAHGADAVEFNLLNMPGGKPAVINGVPGRTEERYFDFAVLLDGISPLQTPVYFKLRDTNLANLSRYFAQYDPSRIMGGITFEQTAAVIWNLALEEAGKDSFVAGFQNSIFSKVQTPYFKPLMIWSDGPPVELLTDGLQSAMGVVEKLIAQGMTAQKILPQIGFAVDGGYHYFLEVAKLRALRLLWWQIGRLYDENLNLVDVFIHARTANAVPPEKEPYQNLISNTTQAMAAIVGGCDALAVSAPLPVGEGSGVGLRVARNVSAILKEESHFDKVTDMGAGSYLIENLTHQLAKAVWERLQF